MAASTSTAAHSNNNSCYDVFISHRGPDVKKTFASHLYRRLISYGLRVFLDYQELQEGEEFPCQIKGAIRTASVQIAIFSPTYADSQWCLDELLFMLESGAPIIPVFHHVKPTELRRTQGEGVYATSLRNLEKKRKYDCEPRYDSKTIENWRNALSRVADISGFDLDEGFHGDEGELLDRLVEVVLKKGKKKLNVARYPTGLDEKVEKFETKLSLHQHSETVQFVGITGLGGAGKTTLAKELFNRKSSSSRYSKSCFLIDVRENVKISIPSLQRKLLKDLTASEEPIDSKDEGLEILRKRFSVLSAPVLLVLDDVDHQDQVYALLPVTDKGILPLPPSSLILITARDKNVLTRSGVQEPSIYQLTGLNTERSRELFCSHAFSQPHPMPGFEDLVNQFVKACNGLPLSLKVFGGLLYGNTNKSYWKDELEELRKALPDEIQKSLQISYDALPREEQQIFLDIACFFIGESRDTAVRVWDASGWNGSRGFENLLSKCLVELDIIVENPYPFYMYERPMEYRIRMHDHLRDMGRYLANNTPGFPFRLWRGTKHIEDLLQQSSEAIRVRGFRMLPWEHYHDDQSVSFSGFKMKGLHLLDIVIEKDPLKCLLEAVDSPNLLCFSWRRCPCTSLPPCIPMRTLRVLKVSGRFLRTLWQEELQAPLQLRELQINAPLSKIPKSIGQLKHLEWMAVSSSSDLIVEIPKEFCDLRSLKHLQLSISNMRSLPDSFGNLSMLEHLDLSRSTDLERLPDSFGTLIKLKHLDLYHCCKLTLSRGTFGKISTLEYINLFCCDKIEVLPSQIAHQRSLEILYLGLPNLKEWSTAIGELNSLEKLVIKIPVLESLPPSLGSDLGNLKYLELRSCQSLKCLPDSFLMLNQLIELTVSDCVTLKRIPDLALLTELRRLDVSFCYELEELPGVEHLRSLEWLKACNCVKLKRIRGSEQLTQLRELDVSFCYELEELQGIEYLRSLEWLKVCNCVKLKTIQGSAQLTELRELNVSFCSELEELPSVDHLKSLKKFQARSCKKLKSIRGSGQQTQLLELKLFDCSELEELPVLEHLKSLEVLQVCNCVKLKRIQGLAQLTKVRELDVSECYDLEQLSGVEHLRSLNKLRAHSCVKLKRIRVSAQLTQLRELDLSFCYGLEELSGVGHLKSLAVLRASGCVNLKSIPGLAQLTQLQELHVSFCYWLEELLDVGHLKSLKVLRASGFLNLTRIRGLEQLTQLRELDVSGCFELEEVPGVENLKSLEVLRASVCMKLKSIQGLERLALLRELEVSHCDELEELLGVQHLELLEKLQAFGCRMLKSIRGLELLTKLRELDVSGCYELEELPSLEQLRSLEVLKACNCLKLKSIQGLASLARLRKLYVSGCSELEELPGMRYLMSLDTLKACNCVKLKSIQGSPRLRELDVSGCSELEEMGVEELQSLAVLRASKCVSLKCLRGLSRLTNLRTLDVTGIPTEVCVLDTL